MAKTANQIYLKKSETVIIIIQKLSYRRLTDTSNFYKRTAITAYPINTIMAPLYLVNQLQNENGVGGFSTVTYSYKDALIHKAGKGFLGFKGITSTGPKRYYKFKFLNT